MLRVLANIVEVQKRLSIPYSECVFIATVIQHTKRRRCVVICGLYYCTVSIHLITQRARFVGGNVIEHNMCVLVFIQILCEKIIIWRRIRRRTVINLRSRVQFPIVSLRHFNHIILPAALWP